MCALYISPLSQARRPLISDADGAADGDFPLDFVPTHRPEADASRPVAAGREPSLRPTAPADSDVLPRIPMSCRGYRTATSIMQTGHIWKCSESEVPEVL